MKTFAFCIAIALSTSAHAAILKSEVVEGLKKICIYSDGSTITIGSAGVCPQTK
jgi:hypothetical protein